MPRSGHEGGKTRMGDLHVVIGRVCANPDRTDALPVVDDGQGSPHLDERCGRCSGPAVVD